MADFVKLAKTAKRLIEANGRQVSVLKQAAVPADPAKPWRGQNTAPVATVSGKAVFVSPGDLGIVQQNLDNVKRADMVALFAAANDAGQTLEKFDLIQDGTVLWKILRAELLQPATKKMLYMFEVAR